MKKLILIFSLLISFSVSSQMVINSYVFANESSGIVVESYVTTTGLTTSSLAATLPSGLSNDDLLIAIIGSSYDGSALNHIKDVTGWTEQVEIVDGSTTAGVRSAIVTRIVDGTEGSTETFTFGSARNIIITIVHITGNATTSPLEVLGTSYQGGSAASHTITGITTLTANSLAFYSFAYDENGTGLPYTPSGTGWSETVSTEIAGIGLSFGTKDMATAGATGDVTITPSRSDGANGVVFNIKQ
jgi:hypothetical protein